MTQPQLQLAPRLASARPDELVQQLRLMQASETDSQAKLAALFHRTQWLPLRLELLDQRKETTRQVERLGSLLAMVDGPAARPIGPVLEWLVERGRAAQLPAAAIVVGPLRLVRAAIASYRAALATATARGLGYAANLLANSLAEKTKTNERLMALAVAISDQ